MKKDTWKKFLYRTGPYNHRFTCKANGYNILFFRGRSYLVKDQASIEQLSEDPFYEEVGKDGTVKEKPKTAKPIAKPSSKPAKAPKLSKAVGNKRA